MSYQRQKKNVSGTTAVDADLVAAVAGKRIYVTAYVLINVGTNPDVLLFESNGVEIWRELAQGAASAPGVARLSTCNPDWLFATNVGERLNLNVSAGDTVHYSLSYYVE